MYYNNGGNYGFNNNGTMAARPAENIVLTQPLTKDEAKRLQSGNKASILDITEDECLVQMCSHKDPESGNITLIDNHNGTCTCSICGETFSMVPDLTDDEVDVICADYNDVIQTAKTGYGPMPTAVGRSLYRTFAFVKKVPAFYRLAMNYYQKWENMGNHMTEQNRSVGAFQNLSMMMNPAGMFGANPAMMGGYGAGAATMGGNMYGGAGMGANMAGNVTGSYGSAMTAPNPSMGADRPIGVVEPPVATGPSPMVGTSDVSKAFKG